MTRCAATLVLTSVLAVSGCATNAARGDAEMAALARALQVAVHQLQKARIDSSLDVRTSLDVPPAGALVIVAPSAGVDIDRASAVAPELADALRRRQAAWPGRHFLGVVSSERVQSLDLQGLGISKQLQAYLAPGRRELVVTLRSLRGEVYVSALR